MMQPPRPRRPRRRTNRSRYWFEAALTIGAAVNALLFMRLAVLMAAVGTERGLPGWLERVFGPIMSPIDALPLLQSPIIGAARLGDFAVIIATLILWFLWLGIIVGWYAEERERLVRSR